MCDNHEQSGPLNMKNNLLYSINMSLYLVFSKDEDSLLLLMILDSR